ncbi:MAG TPA: BamA/TamA family outer membrane protein, partial [Vicinamibacterales bacterium]|nr:BamA/TamA family outer membrane protein [Vicinamibacterales bacterium]
RLSSFSASLIHDTRDDKVDASAGHYLSVNTQLAGQHIGSGFGFTKSTFIAQIFRTVPHTNRIVFAGQAQVGLASGFTTVTTNGQTASDQLPASERFFAGGDTTVRGFALDQLGVRHVPPQLNDTIDPNGFPLGGNGLVVFNAEMRAPLWRGLGAVGFVDTGNVFQRATDISLNELRSAVGTGLRYKSPVGPIRVDLGFKVNRQPGESLTAFFISFGQAF